MLFRRLLPRPAYRSHLSPVRFATSVSSGSTENHAEYCRALVQRHDYESYLCSYFYPRALQSSYFALKAFFLELAMLPETVSNSMIGKMRFQFWRDAISAMGENKPPRHPVVLALHEASKKSNLQRYHLRRIIDGREEEFNNSSHSTVASLTAHAESTYSTLLYLLLSLSNLPDVSGSLSHAASHLGVAQCFTILLRALPFHASHGRLVIPADIAAKHGLRQEEVYRNLRNGAVINGLDDAVYEFAIVANDHLLTARSMFEKQEMRIPPEAMPVFLAGIAVSLYLSRLEKANFDILHPSLQIRDWRLPWRVWRGYHKQMF